MTRDQKVPINRARTKDGECAGQRRLERHCGLRVERRNAACERCCEFALGPRRAPTLKSICGSDAARAFTPADRLGTMQWPCYHRVAGGIALLTARYCGRNFVGPVVSSDSAMRTQIAHFR